jgi:hypothetical protein
MVLGIRTIGIGSIHGCIVTQRRLMILHEIRQDLKSLMNGEEVSTTPKLRSQLTGVEYEYQ